VVVWSDVLGGVQCWEDPLPSCGPTHSTEDGEGGTPAGAPRQPSMSPRDVSAAQQSFCISLTLPPHSNSVSIRYDVMKKCWRMVPTDRPSFSALVQSLEKVLAAVAGYMELSMTLQAPEAVAEYEEVVPPSSSGMYHGHN